MAHRYSPNPYYNPLYIQQTSKHSHKPAPQQQLYSPTNATGSPLMHYPKYVSDQQPMNSIHGICKVQINCSKFVNFWTELLIVFQVAPSLFISSGQGASDASSLRNYGITCIINATNDFPNSSVRGIEYVRIPVDDIPSAQLSAHFEYVTQKINQVSQSFHLKLLRKIHSQNQGWEETFQIKNL